MYRVLLGVAFLLSVCFAKENPVALQYIGVDTLHKHGDESLEKIKVERVHPAECVDVRISVKDIYDGNFAHESVPDSCKKTFVTMVGKVLPMNIAKGVKTVGEIEVIDFIKNRSGKSPKEYILIDSRGSNWYEKFTIPSAINIPFNEVKYDKDFPDDFERVKELLNIKQNGEKFDFSKAKTALLFCNGPWCGQSPAVIKYLLELGYPDEKLLWYRGGVQSWIMLGFNTIKPK